MKYNNNVNTNRGYVVLKNKNSDLYERVSMSFQHQWVLGQ